MTSADTIGCRLALAREEDGNRGMRRQETGDRRQGLGLVINCKFLIRPKGGFSRFYIPTPWFSRVRQKRRIDIEESAFVSVATFWAEPFGASEFGSSLFAALF
jgi:hypothetical protein